MLRRRLVVLIVVIAALAAAATAFVVLRPDGDDRICTAEAVQGPDGEWYSRDPKRDCRFVNADGDLLPGE